jgi:ribosomal protein S12 methylthiotransferase
MRRPERRERQLETLHRIREAIPGISIRTTMIVGFPGETPDDFQQLLDFLEEARFDRVGVFTYSAQEGTRAWELPDDVPDELKRERAERVEEVQRLVTADRYEALLGSTVRAIVDRVPGDGPAQARTDGQADDIDGVTWLTQDESRPDALALSPGEVVDVRLHAVVDDYDFEGVAGRRLSAPVHHHTTPVRNRALPVLSTAGAFGR